MIESEKNPALDQSDSPQWLPKGGLAEGLWFYPKDQ